MTDLFTEEDFDADWGIEHEPLPSRHSSDDPFAQGVDAFKTLGDGLRKKKSRLKKSAEGTGGAKSKTKHEEQKPIVGYHLFSVARPMYDIKGLTELFPLDDTHFSAVRVKTANVVGLGFDLVDSNATRRKKDSVSQNPDAKNRLENRLQNEKFKVIDWLDSLNKDDSLSDTLEKFYTDYEATGNGYIEVGRTKLGHIGYVGHVPAKTMRVRTQRDGFVQIVDNKPVFFRNFGDRTTADPIGNDLYPNEIIHMKKYNPNDMYYGMSDIIPALKAVSGNSFSDDFNLDYFENKAVPRHLVIVKGGKFSSTAQNKILKFFDEDLRGKHHRTLFLEMPADRADVKSSFEITPVEAGEQEASFSLYSKRNMERILMVHRVPVVLLGISENVPHAVGRMADKSFKELTVRPTQRKIEKRISAIISNATDLFTFKLNELTLTDEISQASIDTSYYNMNALVPNEVRSRWGYPGLPDGDKTMAETAEESAVAAAEIKTQQQEQRSNATDSRTRDKTRNANRTDSVGEERSPKGSGRTTQ